MNVIERRTLPTGSEKEDAKEITLLAEQFRSQMGKISRQSLVFFIGTLFTTAVGFFFKIYVARILGSEGLGLFALGMSVVSIFGPFASLGLPLTAARFVAVYVGTDQTQKLGTFLWRSLAIIILSSSGLGALLFLSRHWIANTLYQEADLAIYLPLFALLLPIGTLTYFLSQVLQGYQEVARRTIIGSFINYPLNIALTVAAFVLSWGLWGYIVADIISGLVGLGLMAWLAWRLTPATARHPNNSRQGFEPEVVSFAAYMVGMSILGFLSGRADRVLLGIYLDAGQVGIYSVAISAAAFITILLRSVNSIFSPVIANLYAREKHDLLGRLFQMLTKWTLGFTLPLALIILIFAKELMAIFGADFEAGWPVLVVIAVGQLINVGVGSVGYLLLMSGHQRLEVIASTITTVVSLTLNLLLIPYLGVLGAGIAMAIAIVTANLLRLWQVYRVLGILPYNRHYLRLLFPLGTSAMMALVVRQWWADAAWPVWGSILLALCLAYATFMVTAFLFALDDDDQLMANSVWSTVLRQLRWTGD